jgi:hypothetical protein
METVLQTAILLRERRMRDEDLQQRNYENRRRAIEVRLAHTPPLFRARVFVVVPPTTSASTSLSSHTAQQQQKTTTNRTHDGWLTRRWSS